MEHFYFTESSGKRAHTCRCSRISPTIKALKLKREKIPRNRRYLEENKGKTREPRCSNPGWKILRFSRRDKGNIRVGR